MPYIDVPAHTSEAPQIVSHVQVQGGTNWDLSRSAVQSPITELTDPEVLASSPSDFSAISNGGDALLTGRLVMVVHFPRNSTRAPNDLFAAIKKLPRGYPLKVVANPAVDSGPHTDANARAEVVSHLLESRGFTVVSDDVPLQPSKTVSPVGSAVGIYVLR